MLIPYPPFFRFRSRSCRCLLEASSTSLAGSNIRNHMSPAPRVRTRSSGHHPPAITHTPLAYLPTGSSEARLSLSCLCFLASRNLPEVVAIVKVQVALNRLPSRIIPFSAEFQPFRSSSALYPQGLRPTIHEPLSSPSVSPSSLRAVFV